MKPYVIYVVKNLRDNMKYIGQSECLGANLRVTRPYMHFWKATHRQTNNSYLENSIAKHGKENFIWEVLEFCFSKEEANIQEQEWIKFCNTQYPNGYNIASGGRSFEFSEQFKEDHFRGENHPRGMLGKKHSEETKEKFIERNRIMWEDPLHREKIRQKRLGIKREPYKRKI